MNWCAAAAILLYPFHDMGTAGWITTTVNYFWPVWGMFFVGVLLKKMLVHKKIGIMEGIAGVLVCLSQAVMTGAVILFVVLFCMHRIMVLSKTPEGS